MKNFQTKSSALNRSSQLNIHINSTFKNAANETKRILNESNLKQPLFIRKNILSQILDICRPLLNKKGVHSVIALAAAGFHYTNNGDTTRCSVCDLEISGWTLEMTPFTIHSQRSPKCAYVRSIFPDEKYSPLLTNFLSINTEVSCGEKPNKRLRTEITQQISQHYALIEVNKLKTSRKRTFSHWPSRTLPSSAQMIAAGFFGCNVGDRVICIYCNLICQQWMSNTDDPMEVHKKLSPNCPYIMTVLNTPPVSSIMILNEHSTNEYSSVSNDTDPFRSNGIVFTNACHMAFIEIPRRLTTFEAWPKDNLPSPDDLVRAGFFYTGTKTIVTCFYCNGSLQNWGAHDNPMIEHARWFPNCAYIIQLCGPELYRKIQESKRAQQERSRANALNEQAGNGNTNVRSNRLDFPDESTLSRYVAARLDLFISQSLLDRGMKLSVIKRCLEDQLRVKHDDFIDDCDFLIATKILQKQIQYIDGKKENIIVPNVAMINIHEKEQQEICAREQAATSTTLTNSSINTEMQTAASTNQTTNSLETTTEQQTTSTQSSLTNSLLESKTDSSSPMNPCVLCFTEEKRLACIPCGHLATCVSCGHSLRSCPICRREIEAFVRVFI